MPDDDLKAGGKENNEVIKTYFKNQHLVLG